ncbi:MAG TPA: adenylate/guanylate cyclase domain-containing protein [Candidatus Tectomicrobia bacterium]|nr:adenylate/guanylate cyclase domain-containing protein [Candidatus Tectomicrobia bacterium]
MTFDQVLNQVLDLLQREGRVSYRALKRRFDLDPEYLEDLKAELIDAKRLAVDEDGRVLVWAGQSSAPSAPAPEPLRTPLADIPGHLTEKILQSRTALEGERKQVTVLFADLKGSMELLAERDPEEARQLLDPVLERMIEAVHRYEGTVNQVMGDGIMALFGAPLAHEDHAVRACYAALRMQDSVTRYGDEMQRSHGVPVQIRVGLNSGEVVVRGIDSSLHMDYTAVGQTTHLAARMEQMAKPGSVLITAETLRLAEGLVQARPLGLVPVKGLAQPVEVFELIGAMASQTRLQAAAGRGLTRFVGRQAELEALRQALEQTATGHGQAVAVIGEPGVGKTRLFYEFSQARRTPGWLMLESHSVSYGKATPYLPVRDLLKGYFEIDDRDEARKVREKVTGKLLTLDAALGQTLPALLALLDVPVDDPAWQALDPSQRRQHTLEALKRLLRRESQAQPLLLVFENLHWIDAETQGFLDNLVESLPTARILLLMNYRPEYQHAWGHKTYYTQLRLDPLPPEGAEELLQVLLGDDRSLAPLKQPLVERTEGNPFFLEESVRTLVETGVLGGERGAYRLAKPLQSIQVPATVQAVLAARIDRLSPDEKRLLQAAAVIGTDVPLALLQAIAEFQEGPLRQGLTHLQAAEFLYETRLFPEIEYTFKHALTHQVAYESLLQERRRGLHARIVEALEVLAGERVAEEVERLAHHTLRGEVWDKALAYGRQAGEKAMARSAHREAVGYFEQALSALPHLPEQRDMREQAIDLRLALRSALVPSGDLGRTLLCLREAEALAEALDDPRRLGQVSAFLSNYYYVMGANDQAIAAAQRALALTTSSGDGVLQALANYYLGLAYHAQGGYRQAIDCLGQTMASLEETGRRERFGQAVLPVVRSYAWLAWCHAELGTFAAGRVLGEEGLRIGEAEAQLGSLMYASWGIGLLALRQGDLPRALPLLERAVGLCQDAELPHWFPLTAPALGEAYTLGGRIADAVRLLTQAMEQTTAMEAAGFQTLCSLSLGEAQVLAGRLEEAHALAEGALAHAREYQEWGHQAYALRLLGEIAAQREPPDVEPAADYYQQALTLADELGMRPLLAHCHLGLGKLYLKTGGPDPARAELSAAIDLYRTMEMTFWLPRAETALAQLSTVRSNFTPTRTLPARGGGLGGGAA